MIRLSALVLAVSLTAAAADVKEVNRVISLDSKGSLSIENHKGAIHVTTWDRPEVSVKAVIQAESGSQMDRRLFDGTEILIDGSGNSVSVRTKYPNTWCCSDDQGNNPEVRYTIQMPRTAHLAIRDHRSDSEIADVEGGLDITTHRGNVKITGLAGPLHVDTHRGTVTAAFRSFNGDSSIDTHRGTIDLTMPRASRFDLQTDFARQASLETDFPVMSRASGRIRSGLNGTVNGGGPALRITSHRGSFSIHSL